MKKLIKFETAGKVAIALYLLFIVFHLLILLNLIPNASEIVWGGRIETREELVQFELLSAGILLLASLFTAVRVGWIHAPWLNALSRVIMWVLFVLFLLNTLGNLVAITAFEKTFAVITFLLAICSLRLGLSR